MTKAEFRRILENLDQLERDAPSISPSDAELLLLGTLTPLLRDEGFSVTSTPQGRDSGVDYIGTRSADDEQKRVSIGIEYKHYRESPVGLSVVHAALGASLQHGFDRLLLVTSSRFTKDAMKFAKRNMPVIVELLDFAALRSWISRVGQPRTKSRVVEAITDLSRRLARLIAEDQESLREIEWRDLERVLAAVFEGIGFTVELTPGSKDHGKDIILKCRVAGQEETYIVEVKHWRSGKTVGKKYVTDFINVVAREERHGGLFVSSSGYSDEVEMLTEVERQTVRLGRESKIVALCQTYSKLGSGVWSAPKALPEILFSGTL